MDTSHCPYCFSFTPKIPCSHCGWQTPQDNPPPALPLGRVLDGRYRIGRVLGHGGFGITYLAWDDNLQLRLAIKEYLPRDCASRAADGVSLAIYSGQASEQFSYGLDRFLDEARALAHFDQHPGIVTVKNFFRAHGTGYCVMDYVEGITLSEYLGQQPDGRISFEAALKLLMPVMDALRAVHKEGLLHRDIAPDNIYLTQDGRIKLLDFGAARYAASEHSKSLSIILKPGYAPEEQYRTKGNQGPWTDVYGLAATFYRTITGKLPPESLDRLDTDELIPPSKLGIAIRTEQEAALLKGLAVKASQRFQSMVEFQQAWKTEVRLPPPLVVDQGGRGKVANEVVQLTAPSKKGKSGSYFAVASLLILFVTALWHLTNHHAQDKITAKIALAEQAFKDGDYVKAQAIFTPLAEEGDAVAQVYIGLMYQEGHGFTQDFAQAFQWYRKAAEQEEPHAQNLIGIMYDEGKGVAKDDTEAVRWYRKAAEQGLPVAQSNLGGMYEEGEGVAKNEPEAVLWYRKAAEQGHAVGQNNLGVMYQDGRGVASDEIEAVRWYRKAAEQGDAVAQNNLGAMYKKGQGVTQDYTQAIHWHRKAAEQGNAIAQNNLAVMYSEGQGVVKDQAEAVRWYRKAAEQGVPESQFALGMAYEDGEGITRNTKQAVRWYREAAKQGNADAKDALKRLGK